mgnify:FL=1
MLDFLRAKHSRVLVWTLLVLLVIGLAGFGIGNSGALTSDDVAVVGDRSISEAEYARALDREVRTLSNRLGRALPMSEARQYGMDTMVLARLVNDAALDEEADRLGLSVGDDAVGAQVMTVNAFRGPDGKFDRQTYEMTLRNNGLDPADFEEDLRRETTREMLANGVQSAAAAPVSAAATILGYLGERRGFDWIEIGPAALPEPVPAPTEEQLRAEYDAHNDRYTRPETRHVTYVSVAPETLAASIEVPEADLRAAYDAEPARFNTPERRALDRIGFATDADAAAAKARLDAGEIDFDALAVERGLTSDQIDQGDVAAASLTPAARAAVFGATEPGIIGPVSSALGPSLYRINAILAATSTPFEAARDELRQERALKLAADRIAADTAAIEDLVAGGATLEEIDTETEMTLGTIELTAATTDGIAADPAFRDLATQSEVGETTDVVELAGGGLVALRVDSIDAPALIPLPEVRDRVAADWTAAETGRRLTAVAQGFGDEVRGGLPFADLARRLGLAPIAAAPGTRDAVAPGVSPELMTDIFAAEQGALVTAPDAGGSGLGVVLAQLTAIQPFDPEAEANKTAVLNAETQLRGQVAEDLLALYTGALRDAAGVTLHQNQLDAVLTRFP